MPTLTADSAEPNSGLPPEHRAGRRLTAADASFLAHEMAHPGISSEIAALLPLEGGTPSLGAVREQIAERLSFLPLLSCRLEPAGALTFRRPRWKPASVEVDDHVHELEGRDFASMCDRVLNAPLDRALPLWGLWLLRDEDGRAALLYKAHHALHDGVSLAVVINSLLSQRGRASDAPAPCRSESSSRRRAFGAATGLPHLLVSAAQKARRLPVAPHQGGRRCGWVTVPLKDLRSAKSSLRGTVNDVYLTVVARALALWSDEEGTDLPQGPLTALVPVNMRRSDQRAQLGNHLSLLSPSLPVLDDIGSISELIQAATRTAKSRHQPEAAALVASTQKLVPAFLLPHITRLNTSPRLFSLMASNVQGPTPRLRLYQATVSSVVGMNFLPAGHPVAFWLFSYADAATISVVADSALAPRLPALLDALETALAELAAVTSQRSHPLLGSDFGQPLMTAGRSGRPVPGGLE